MGKTPSSAECYAPLHSLRLRILWGWMTVVERMRWETVLDHQLVVRGLFGREEVVEEKKQVALWRLELCLYSCKLHSVRWWSARHLSARGYPFSRKCGGSPVYLKVNEENETHAMPRAVCLYNVNIAKLWIPHYQLIGMRLPNLISAMLSLPACEIRDGFLRRPKKFYTLFQHFPRLELTTRMPPPEFVKHSVVPVNNECIKQCSFPLPKPRKNYCDPIYSCGMWVEHERTTAARKILHRVRTSRPSVWQATVKVFLGVCVQLSTIWGEVCASSAVKIASTSCGSGSS